MLPQPDDRAQADLYRPRTSAAPKTATLARSVLRKPRESEGTMGCLTGLAKGIIMRKLLALVVGRGRGRRY